MILENKISGEIAAESDVILPVIESTNYSMILYGDTNFKSYILKKSIYFCLNHSTYMDDEIKLELYKLLKLNT